MMALRLAAGRISLLLVGVLFVSFGARGVDDDSNRLMVEAAHRFISSLTPEQREQTQFEFTQKGFEAWHFIPMRTRSGIKYSELTSSQVRLADMMVASGLSRTGYHKAKGIMSLEQVLLELEMEQGGTPFTELRNPDFYYFAIFGEPSTKGIWGWRLEGHHISFHFAMRDGKIIGASPMFMGTNPHEVQKGRHKGLRILEEEEDKARALLESLTEKQRNVAVISNKAPNDIKSRNFSAIDYDVVEAEGLKKSAMNAEQKSLLQALIDEYISNVPEDLRGQRRQRVSESGDDVYFAWMGDLEPGIGHPHYYRVHGRTFLIEYDNVQNDANHAHTVWRDYTNDFGRDMLADHYRAHHE